MPRVLKTPTSHIGEALLMIEGTEMAAATDRGRIRLHNEDCIAHNAAIGLAVLADGMGGHNAGEVASRIAVEVIASGIEGALVGSKPRRASASAASLISEFISQANERIYRKACTCRNLSGMGTTVVVALWHSGCVSVGHVGDSRLYRLRSHELEQLTHDHSLAQEHVDRGLMSLEEARVSSVRNVLTRTVGNAGYVVPELSTYAVAPHDLYLLCSDGLTDMLTDEQIAQVLHAFRGDIQRAAEALIDEANREGGVDNISLILARMPGVTVSGGDK
jgi:PPM family protein phosphatase